MNGMVLRGLLALSLLFVFQWSNAQFKVNTITRNSPSTQNTLDSNFQFNITFSHRALQLDTGDLSLNGGIAAKSKINSVKYVGGTSYLVDVKTTDTSSGTLGLDIKGVDGSGSNNIIQGNLQLDQQSLAKIQITDSKVFGQSFIPATSGKLVDIVVRTGIGHTYNGNGTMELITGEGYGGTVIASQVISVDQSHSEKTYTFSSPAVVSAGSKYTMRFNFPNAPTNSTAFSAQVGANYPGGYLYQSSILASADLYFKTYIHTGPDVPLTSTLPTVDETYQFVVCKLAALITKNSETSCMGTGGSATATASKGNISYSYLWDNGDTSASSSKLLYGTNSITVTDAYGCSVSKSITMGSSCSLLIKGNNQWITLGDTTPTPTDKTDLGPVSVGDSLTQTFTLINNGSGTLNFSSPITLTGSHANLFSIAQAPASTVNAGDSTSFSIRFKPNALGTFKVTVNIPNSSTDANPYTFSIQGQGSHSGFNFDGGNDYIEIADDTTLDFSHAFTVEAWIKPDGAQTSGILTKFGNGASNRSWALLLLSSGKLELSVSNNGNSETYFNSASSVNLGFWNHVVFRFDSTKMEVFINGVKDLNSQTVSGSIFNSSSPVLIGARDNGSVGLNYRGDMDEVRLWSVARPDTAILNSRNCELSGSETGLVAYYNFNQGIPNGNNAGASLVDQSTKNNDGTFQNASLTGSSSNFVTGAITHVAGPCAVPLSTSLTISQAILCNGNSNGSIMATVNGGIPPYTYAWSNGSTTATANNVVAGKYWVTVTDNNGVSSAHTQTLIDSIIITEPSKLTATLVVDSNVSCYGELDGGLTASATGGTAGYSYAWSNGATSASITGVAAGSYKVTVSDANACIDTISGIITQPSLLASADTLEKCVSYTWPSTGISYTQSGIYKDTLQASNGCDSIITLNLTINQPSSSSLAVTACDTYTWAQNSMTYTASGAYKDTVMNSVNCDSIITLNLTINKSTSSSLAATACDTYTWAQNSMTYTSSGAYKDTVMNSMNCDSIITLNLTINKSTSSSLAATACDTYTWAQNSMTYTASGAYKDTVMNSVNCDSIITLNLTINKSTSSSVAVTACDTYTWAQNSMTYTASGAYKDTVMNSVNCDSIITLNLTINKSTSSSLAVTACDTYTWAQNSMTYTASGAYKDTVMNSVNCDSIITLNLTINKSTSSSLAVTACDTYTWAQNSMTYTASGAYKDTVMNSVNCDSIITLNLTINKSTSSSLAVTACDTYTWAQNSMTYTASGAYKDTVMNSVNCDSIITLNLTINKSTSSSLAVTACDTYTWSQNNMTYTASGAYKDTVMNSVNCDSIITLNLTINKSTSSSLAVTACDTYTWAQNSMTYTASGAYKDTVMNSVNCDSIITLNLTINKSTSSSLAVTACDTYTWVQNSMTYTASGSYNDTIMNAANCDSIITLNLTINKSTASSVSVTTCDSYTWAQNNMTYTVSGNYSDTVVNANKCDSIITLNLTINPSVGSSVSVSSCEEYTWAQTGMTYTSSGSYTDTLSTSLGCDSVLTLNLTILKKSLATVKDTSCLSYIWALNGQTYTQSGTYIDTVMNQAGCDSIVTLELIIDTVNVTVTQNDLSLEAQLSGASYQWMTCGAGFNPIAGATGQSYTVISNGDYAVEITQNGCADTSDCLSINYVGLENEVRTSNNFKLFPNPTTGRITLFFSEIPQIGEPITVYNLNGKQVMWVQPEANEEVIDLSELGNGLYFIRYQNQFERIILNR
ncbi:choice-of-anchor D domain-containing protein [bacterium SCSIO 12741]|nr:choice-of-anchor D domain-containing protein [bacterium SCSIO 12741]